MSEANPISSLLSHCTSCKAKCCKDAYIIHTKAEYRRIIDAGHDDHFKEITVPEGSFYVLYFRGAPCPYLQANNTCGIEKVKSDTCRAYPARAAFDMKSSFLHASFDKGCPAVTALSDEFRSMAEALMQQHASEAPYALQNKIINQYHQEIRMEKRAQQRQHVIDTIIKPTLSPPQPL